MVIELEGTESKEFYNALLDAYPDQNALKKMVKFQLSENLEKIVATEKPYDDVVFDLITWAEAKGKLKDLIIGAYEENSGNPKLKEFYQKKLPFASIINIITSEQWKELSSVLSEIDYNILQKTCRETLISRNTKNIEDHVPKIINFTSLRTLKEILLTKYPLSKDGSIPTIVEFVERLTKNQNIPEADRSNINNWLTKIVEEKNIELPLYHEKPIRLPQRNINSHLLITIEKESGISDNFILKAELIHDYQEKQEYLDIVDIPLHYDGLIICSLDEIKNKIDDLIAKTKAKIRQEYKCKKYTLIIELFLPIKYLKHPFDLEEVNAGLEKKKPMGYQYRLVTRCLQRYLVTEETSFGDFLTALEERWEFFQNSLQKFSVESNLEDQFIYLNSNDIIEVGNRDEFALANEWVKYNKLVLNVVGYFPENIENQEKIFNCLLRGGIPISFWHKCPKLTCDEIRQKLADILTINSLQETQILLENVFDTRKNAHDQYTRDQETAQNQPEQPQPADYFGYQLGFLCDHPYRVPSKFNYAQGGDALSGFD
ncbi:effector-associated domain EAD1-containing protein [Nodularia spumigena CS-591/12]|uniref:effector-associated domain EAD1-containing protein n=1 Tax=Nodularia spumigena TaxID=70799 RepID=UPI00232EF311|nr:effector-associated domain EAD1-containing protein [Nodularia spumigena]MDB9303340.1 effector-associated domain EAD1-containing protein [Nodularia spumigena CS-591/12]